MLTIDGVMQVCSRLACVVGLLALPIAGCGDSSSGDGGTGGSSGTGGVAATGGTGASGGTGGSVGCDCPGGCDPVTMFFETVEREEDFGVGAVLEGVRICEVGTQNCATSNEEGKATLELPGCEDVAWTFEKEGYGGLAGADVTDDTLDAGPFTWGLLPNELAEVWSDELETTYPWTGTFHRAVPGRVGATYELVDEAAKTFYMDEAGRPSLDLTATTSRGNGGFVDLAPGEIEVEFGGTATDCVASIAWTSSRPNTMRVPILDGFVMVGSMRCGEP